MLRATSSLACLVLCALACGDDSPAPSGGAAAGGSHSGGAALGGNSAAGGQGGSVAIGGNAMGGNATGGSSTGGCGAVGVETCATPADEDCDGNECATWTRVYGDTENQSPATMAVNAAGDVYLVGAITSMEFGGMTLQGDAAHKLFFAKLSSNGDELWSMLLPTQTIYTAARLLPMPDSGVLLLIDFTGSIEIAGTVLSGAPGSNTAFVKFAPDGSVDWSKVLSSPSGSVYVHGIGTNASGDVFALGGSQTVAFFGTDAVASGVGVPMFGFDGLTGELHFSKLAPLPQDAFTHSINDVVVAENGNAFVIGTYKGGFAIGGAALPASGAEAGFLAEFDANGDHVASTQLCTERCDPGRLAVGPDDELYVSGQTLGIVTLGDKTLSSSLAVFVARLSPSWQVDWLTHYYDDMDPSRSMSTPELFVRNGELKLLFATSGTVNTGFGVINSVGDLDLVIGSAGLDGTPHWLRNFGSPGARIRPNFIDPFQAVGPSGEWTLGVALEGSTALGSLPFTSQGGIDVGVARLAP